MMIPEASKTIFIRALMDASGHTEVDAALILDELHKAGWHLVKVKFSDCLSARPLTRTQFLGGG